MNLFFTLFFVLHGLFFLLSESSEECTFNENSCELKLGTEVNSLSKYKGKMINYDAGSEDSNRRYWIMPCDVVMITSECSMYKGCQSEQHYGGSYPLGDPDKSVRDDEIAEKCKNLCPIYGKKVML